MSSEEIILRFRDGSTRKTTDTVEIDHRSGDVIVDGNQDEKLSLDDLKAIFFLGPARDSDQTGSLILVEFEDGEHLRGRAPEYKPSDRGFMMYPTDSDRVASVFIVTSAVRSIEVERF